MSHDPERAFLHDIATPVVTVLFALENALEDLKAKGGDPEVAEQLRLALESAEKLSKLLHARRALLQREAAK